MMDRSAIERILDLARWAPSGDNTQPWRFDIADDNRLVVHGFDTRRDCVYDFQGHASQIALGALLENIAIAASAGAMRAEFAPRAGCSDEHPVFDVHFIEAEGLPKDPLIELIPIRSVQRRPYRTRPLTSVQKAALESSLGQDHQVLWLEGLPNRLRMAGLVSDAGRLRLTIPEAYQVHRKIIAWNSRYSDDRVPDQAVGLDRLSLILMRHVLKSWKRVDFFNTYLAGTLIPRIELDILPAIACAAHFFIASKSAPASMMDYVNGGRVMQRFWLTATMLGLQLQPEMSPLIFSNYARCGITLSEKPGAKDQAEKIASRLEFMTKSVFPPERILFMGRLGHARAAASRSVRLTPDRLKY